MSTLGHGRGRLGRGRQGSMREGFGGGGSGRGLRRCVWGIGGQRSADGWCGVRAAQRSVFRMGPMLAALMDSSARAARGLTFH